MATTADTIIPPPEFPEIATEEELKEMQLEMEKEGESIPESDIYGYYNYCGYRTAAGNRTFVKKPMLAWKDLGDQIRKQWIAGATAVQNKLMSDATAKGCSVM